MYYDAKHQRQFENVQAPLKLATLEVAHFLFYSNL